MVVLWESFPQNVQDPNAHFFSSCVIAVESTGLMDWKVTYKYTYDGRVCRGFFTKSLICKYPKQSIPGYVLFTLDFHQRSKNVFNVQVCCQHQKPQLKKFDVKQEIQLQLSLLWLEPVLMKVMFTRNQIHFTWKNFTFFKAFFPYWGKHLKWK